MVQYQQKEGNLLSVFHTKPSHSCGPQLLVRQKVPETLQQSIVCRDRSRFLCFFILIKKLANIYFWLILHLKHYFTVLNAKKNCFGPGRIFILSYAVLNILKASVWGIKKHTSLHWLWLKLHPGMLNNYSFMQWGFTLLLPINLFLDKLYF